MPKYSTGGSGGGDGGDACELCGSSSDSLRAANVAGANLQVCPDCAPHDDAAKTDRRTGNQGQDDSERDRRRRAARNAARAHDAMRGDSTHWEEEGTDYEDDPLPYLVRGYDERVTEARQDAGLQRGELAEELDADEADLLAVEQGRAAQAGVGGGLIAALEDRLDVELSE